MAFRGRALLPIVFGPTVWALYFLVAYVVAAVVCVKDPEAIDTARVALAVTGGLCVLAVAASGALAGMSWRRDLAHAGEGRLSDASEVSRRAFLAFATVLLDGLSVVAIVFTAAPLLLAGTCR